MQAFCLRRSSIAPRVFQQACRYSSRIQAPIGKKVKTKSHRPNPPPKPKGGIAPQTARNVPTPSREDDDESIRWFEKDMQTGEIRRVAGNPEEIEARELRQQIKALQAELKEYESDEEGLSEKAMLEHLEPEEREKVIKALGERKNQTTALTDGLDISLELPTLTVPVLKKFNATLHLAALNPTQVKYRKELWRWYSRAKYNIPALPRMVPEKAWDVLWKTQSVKTITNPDREPHIAELSDDMISVGHELTREQYELRMEALVAVDRQDDAVNEWESDYDRTAGRDQQVLELGVKLFSAIGGLSRALSLLRECFDNFSDSDARIVVTLMAPHIQRGNDHIAFALYLLMRSRLSQDMTMEQYDIVILAFLQHGKTDLALAVFRDMMLQGANAVQKGALVEKQEETLYDEVFGRMYALQSHSDTPAEVDNLRLSALSVLPKEWRNKFFYGSWLKKLIGMGEVLGAAKVVELMFERGVIPDVRHLNGLISAFMRSGQSDLQERGELLGWSMIQQRLDFVRDRGATTLQEGVNHFRPVVSVSDPGAGFEISIPHDRPVPSAILETFNVLATHYLVKERWSHLAHLHHILKSSAIKMGPYFMNHLLYAQLYTNGQEALWKDFVRYGQDNNPDTETFSCLWTAELRQSDPYRRQNAPQFPAPRRLFQIMTEWYDGLQDWGIASTREDFTPEIYAKIVQSFCYKKDFDGLLVAMHGISHMFQAFPDAEIARLVSEAVSNIPEEQIPTVRGRRGLRQLPKSTERNKNIAKVIAALAKRRAAAALEHGVKIEELTGDEKAKENLNLLSELIRVILVRSSGSADDVEAAIERASREMGVPGISTGDLDASNVS